MGRLSSSNSQILNGPFVRDKRSLDLMGRDHDLSLRPYLVPMSSINIITAVKLCTATWELKYCPFREI